MVNNRRNVVSIISVICVVILILCMIPSTVFADDYGDDGDPNAEMVSITTGMLLCAVTPDKESVHKGGSITITVTTLAGDIASGMTLYANDEPFVTDENGQYKFTNMQENIHITQLKSTTTVVQDIYVVYTIKAPEDAEGYAIDLDKEEVRSGDSVTVTVTILDEYYKTDNFAVYANDKLVTLDDNNQFTLDNVHESVTVRVEGLAKKTKAFARYYGPTRYDTSIEAAKIVKENLGLNRFDNVVITSGENFADALSGAYLAKLRNAPILGVNKATESKIRSYVNSNLKSSGTVYILGGTGVVSQTMEDNLKADGYTVIRLGGATRYDTNLEILKECGVNGEDILVCSGTSYPDSLSASAAGRPIMLVGSTFTSDQTTYLNSISRGNMYIIGGVGAVNAGVEKAAANYGTTKRLGGATRYDTSVLVASEFFPGNCDKLVLAYGQNFPDGLSGGPLAITMDAPLILTMDNYDVAQKAADFAADKNVNFIAVLGGPTLIPDTVVNRILNISF